MALKHNIEVKYPAIFRDEGTYWGVRFPDVPDAQTFGNSVQAAADNAANALAVTLFDQEPPRASDPRFWKLASTEFVVWITMAEPQFGAGTTTPASSN
ncbi:RNA-binding protein [Lactiplantibacillus mudanjiangensis]|uniref:RNA-binding protein n=1 Tax=Lactiplantibacillus mudanjiangensis TaxID=1296538 RepID=UPI001CDB9C2A|nr:RNA-binding protein [Lactiplantibacillus mudanjiangensis]